MPQNEHTWFLQKNSWVNLISYWVILFPVHTRASPCLRVGDLWAKTVSSWPQRQFVERERENHCSASLFYLCSLSALRERAAPGDPTPSSSRALWDTRFVLRGGSSCQQESLKTLRKPVDSQPVKYLKICYIYSIQLNERSVVTAACCVKHGTAQLWSNTECMHLIKKQVKWS